MDKRFSDIWEEFSGEELTELLEPIVVEAPKERLVRRAAAGAAEKMAVPEQGKQAAAEKKKQRRRGLTAAAAVAAIVLLGIGLKPLLPGRIPAASPAEESESSAEPGNTEETVPAETGAEKRPIKAARLSYLVGTSTGGQTIPEASRFLFGSHLLCFDGEARRYDLDLAPFYIQSCLEQEDGVLLNGFLQAQFWEKDEVGRSLARDYYEYKGQRWTRSDLRGGLSVPWMIRLDRDGNILWEKEIRPEGSDEAFRGGRLFYSFGIVSRGQSGTVVFSVFRETDSLKNQDLLVQYYGPDGEWEKTQIFPLEEGYPANVFGMGRRFVIVMTDQRGFFSKLIQLDPDEGTIRTEALPESLFPGDSQFLISCVLPWNGKLWFSLQEQMPQKDAQNADAARQFVGQCAADMLAGVPLIQILSDPLYDGTYPGEAAYTNHIKAQTAAVLYSYDISGGTWQTVSRREGCVGAQLYLSDEDMLVWEDLAINIVIPTPTFNAYSSIRIMNYQKSGFSGEGRLLSEDPDGQTVRAHDESYTSFETLVPSWYAKQLYSGAYSGQVPEEEEPGELTFYGEKEIREFLTAENITEERLSRYEAVRDVQDYRSCMELLAELPVPVCEGWSLEELTIFRHTNWARFTYVGVIPEENNKFMMFTMGLFLGQEDPWERLKEELGKHERPTETLRSAQTEALCTCPGENNGMYWYWGITEGHYFSLSFFESGVPEDVITALAERLSFTHFEVPGLP